MNIIFEEIIAGLPDARQMASLTIRLVTAMFLGAIVGIQREHLGKPAGLRTHMLVAFGAALFVLAAAESGINSDRLSRVIQGLITGIGFLGAGAILKLQQEREIEGLTTAAGIWMTAAIGVAVGLGRLGLAHGKRAPDLDYAFVGGQNGTANQRKANGEGEGCGQLRRFDSSPAGVTFWY